ncbi:hypothetical protein [Synechococcus sp. EJ6-Ellesmere]|uniref:hypothetical protein n=1 Tax=Synechococcus sp. EJ6-Ellesmere TaxID=2823734 RepID=UPI0020CF1F3B|nr:hypothetical protein [Synechococcus sp. EJ6-Ellesmere]
MVEPSAAVEEGLQAVEPFKHDKPDKPPKPEEGKPTYRPTKPGRPWAGSQPEVEDPELGTDPTVPTAPPPTEPPEQPSDPTQPEDPTVPIELNSDMPVLELPPEGLLRLSKEGEEDRFSFPCHCERWQEMGWTVEIPRNLAEGAEPLEGFPDVELLGLPEESEGAPDVTLPGAPPPPEPLPGDGMPEPQPEPMFPDPVVSDPAVPDPPAELGLVDYNTMTKAQIIASVEADYGVSLDAGMTKAELIAEAGALASAGPATAGPAAADPLVEPDEAEKAIAQFPDNLLI